MVVYEKKIQKDFVVRKKLLIFDVRKIKNSNERKIKRNRKPKPPHRPSKK